LLFRINFLDLASSVSSKEGHYFCANLEFARSPAGLPMSVLEAVEAASIASAAKCSDALLDIIEIHSGPPFTTSRFMRRKSLSI
jgi:hypothetical protein